MESFKHKIQIQIRFKDLDILGHVNNANYFGFVELARLKYFDAVLGPETDWHIQHGLIMARFEIDYKQAITYDNNVFVYTRCSRLGTKSFDLSWLMKKQNEDATEEILAKGRAVIACYEYTAEKTIEIPPNRRKLIEEFEGKIIPENTFE